MPISRLFILSGTTSHAFPAQINKLSLFDDTECQLPLWSAFKDLKDSEGVANLVVRGNAALKKFRMCTPVPPFLAFALINEGGSSIPDLIITAVNKIHSFDKEHKDESNFVKAETYFQHVVNWLYAASIDSDKILPVLSTPPLIPSSLTSQNKSMRSGYIPPPPSRSLLPPSPTMHCFNSWRQTLWSKLPFWKISTIASRNMQTINRKEWPTYIPTSRR